jgi:hypothetical protein
MELAIRILRWIAFMLLAITEGGELNVPEVRVTARSIGRGPRRRREVGGGSGDTQDHQAADRQMGPQDPKKDEGRRAGRAKAEIMSPPAPDKGPAPEASPTKIEPIR